jgi:hypothetical protein
MTLPAAWRARWWIWALPLAVVLINAVLLVVHPGRTGAGFAEMEEDLAAETKVLAALEEKERTMGTVLAEARSSREALHELYRDRFATEAERLTRLITEVKRLAQRAGLVPASISYPVQTIDQYGLVRMSLVFGVQGSYTQLRTLINLLELSDLFLVLEQVGLRPSATSGLGINLQISTFFVQEPDAGMAASAPRGTRSSAERPSDGRTNIDPSSSGPSSSDPSSSDPSSSDPSGSDPSPSGESRYDTSSTRSRSDEEPTPEGSSAEDSSAVRDDGESADPLDGSPQS